MVYIGGMMGGLGNGSKRVWVESGIFFNMDWVMGQKGFGLKRIIFLEWVGLMGQKGFGLKRFMFFTIGSCASGSVDLQTLLVQFLKIFINY